MRTKHDQHDWAMATLLYRTLDAASAVPAARLLAQHEGPDALVVSRGTRLCVYRCDHDAVVELEGLQTYEHVEQIVSLQLNPATGLHCFLTLAREGSVRAYASQGGRIEAIYGAVVPLEDAVSYSSPSGSYVLSAPVRHRYQQDQLLLSAVSSSYDNIVVCSVTCSGDDARVKGLKAESISAAKALLAGMHWQGPQSLPQLVTQSIAIKQMAFLEHLGDAVCDAAGCPLLCVLSEALGPGGPACTNLDCLALDLGAGSALRGPWSCRNVHPTTSLLAHFPGSSALPSGLLVVSSRSLQLFTTTPEPAALAHLPAALPAKRTLLQLALPGLPSCIEAVSAAVYVLGDSTGALHVLYLGGSAPWASRLSSTCPTPAPSVLRYIPPAAPAADGMLFVGSTSGSSQLLGLPHGLLSRGTQPVSPPALPTLSPALIPSAAPIVDAITVPSGQAPDELQAVLCCGRAPAGRLLRSHLAAGLEPSVLDGPEVPGGVQLFALPARWGRLPGAAAWRVRPFSRGRRNPPALRST
jgi:hypothetical protein